jgi:hypothetical protein
MIQSASGPQKVEHWMQQETYRTTWIDDLEYLSTDQAYHLELASEPRILEGHLPFDARRLS